MINAYLQENRIVNSKILCKITVFSGKFPKFKVFA
jgi:hypothetical protein